MHGSVCAVAVLYQCVCRSMNFPCLCVNFIYILLSAFFLCKRQMISVYIVHAVAYVFRVYIIKNSLRFIHGFFFCVMLAYVLSEIMPKLLAAYFFCVLFFFLRTHILLVNLPGFLWKKELKKKCEESLSTHRQKLRDILCAMLQNFQNNCCEWWHVDYSFDGRWWHIAQSLLLHTEKLQKKNERIRIRTVHPSSVQLNFHVHRDGLNLK